MEDPSQTWVWTTWTPSHAISTNTHLVMPAQHVVWLVVKGHAHHVRPDLDSRLVQVLQKVKNLQHVHKLLYSGWKHRLDENAYCPPPPPSSPMCIKKWKTWVPDQMILFKQYHAWTQKQPYAYQWCWGGLFGLLVLGTKMKMISLSLTYLCQGFHYLT